MHQPQDFPGAALPERRYANYFAVGHNPFEFLFDIGQYYPEQGPARFDALLVTSPAYAKAFLQALQKAVDEYQQAFGAIQDVPTSPSGPRAGGGGSEGPRSHA
jgi:hypothetical protein